MRNVGSIKAQDILILLKLSLWDGRSGWKGVDLARELGLSTFEISVGLDRCRYSGLLDPSKKKLMRSAFLEFLVHGLKYIFPAHLGPVCRGIPTAHSAPPLFGRIASGSDDVYVWADDFGKHRGHSVDPIYATAPQAARTDPELYELLALVDAVRIGRARDRALAVKELEKRFGRSS